MRFSKIEKVLAISALVAMQISTGSSFANAAQNNVLLIFDSSGSMKKSVDGQSRMAAAKAAVAAALPSIPSGTRVGLMAFGNRRAKDCSDINLITPLGEKNAERIAAQVAAFEPKGETPIAAAIDAAAKGFAALKGQNNGILLVTDGIEECGGDPCAAAKQVKAMDLDLKVNVVGLNLDNKQRAALECLSTETGGKFFSADKAADFGDTLKEAIKTADALPPPKSEPAPTSNSVFKDDFDGDDLAKHWQVKNANKDGYIVEKGELLLVAGGAKSGFDVGKTSNIIQLNQDLPGGDWRLSAIVKAQYQTTADGVWFGLYKDEGNFVAAHLHTKGNGLYGWALTLRVVKASDGKLVHFEKEVRKLPCLTCKSDQMFPNFAETIAMPMELSLTKRGRQYSASVALSGEKDKSGQQLVHETEQVASLRAPGGLALAGGQNQNVKGETLFYFDKVEIHGLK